MRAPRTVAQRARRIARLSAAPFGKVESPSCWAPTEARKLSISLPAAVAASCRCRSEFGLRRGWLSLPRPTASGARARRAGEPRAGHAGLRRAQSACSQRQEGARLSGTAATARLRFSRAVELTRNLLRALGCGPRRTAGAIDRAMGSMRCVWQRAVTQGGWLDRTPPGDRTPLSAKWWAPHRRRHLNDFQIEAILVL